MTPSKFLTESGWKDILSKNKGLKDNGLQKALASVGRAMNADDFDQASKALDEAGKLAGLLKKAKEVVALAPVSKHLAEMLSAIDAASKEVAKGKVEAEKKAKADAMAKKKEQDAQKSGKDDDEDEESPDLLTTKMVPLLRMVNKGITLHTLIASTGKRVVVMLSRKPISPARRKMLAEELGASGGVKYYVGHCLNETGMTTFVLNAEVAGMAKKIKLALLEQTKLRVKVRCRGEGGETDHDGEEEDQPDDLAQGGAEDAAAHAAAAPAAPAAAPATPAAPAQAPAASDGGAAAPDAAADTAPPGGGGAAPAPAAAKAVPQALAAGPQVWDGTRAVLRTNIEALKKAIQAQLAGESESFIKEINGQMQQLDRILVRLDERLADSLRNAAKAPDEAQRKAELMGSKTVIAEYIRYVGSEPLIDHIDRNPFGVKTDLKATLTKSLTTLARAIG